MGIRLASVVVNQGRGLILQSERLLEGPVVVLERVLVLLQVPDHHLVLGQEHVAALEVFLVIPESSVEVSQG